MCGFQGFRDLLGDRQRLVERDRSLLDAIRQRRPFHEFEDQRPNAISFFQTVDLRDVGMVQRRQDFGLTLEPRQAVWVRREGIRQYLATSRFSLVSVACQTWPMPPSPILAVMEYGPRVALGSKAIS